MKFRKASEIQVGVIGYGGAFNMGKAHINEMKQAGMTPCAVCEIDKERLQAATADFPGIETYSSVAAMLKRSSVNLITIITPHNTHAKLALQCLNAGRSVVCEKPLAITTTECDAMLAAARKKHVVLSTYHNRHWDGCILNRALLLRSSDHIERHESAVRVLSATPGIHWDDTILANLTNYSHLPELVPGWLRGAERPTAFLVDADGLAAELIAQFKAAGARVPEDVSVCAVAGPLVPDPHPGTVTGIGFDFVAMGRKAAELLKWRCEQPAEALSPAVYRVGYEWVEGRTCGARA